MNFFKMHALGNDFCIFGSPYDKHFPDKELIKTICERKYGIGCDCAVFIGHTDTADYFMHVFNPDGFEAEICGNALRCSAKYVCEMGYFKKRCFSVQTQSGNRSVSVYDDKIVTEIGIPLISDPYHLNVGGFTVPCVTVSMGNPHCVLFIKDLSDDEFMFLGKAIERHHDFPDGTNVEFATIEDCNTIKMRVWERGIGETDSCTTGSCACVAAASLLGHEFQKCDVVQRGGTVTVTTNEDGTMRVEGCCKIVFKGTLLT